MRGADRYANAAAMTSMARLRIGGRRRLALLLVACALLLRTAMPAGWMPEANAAGLTLKWCADAGERAAPAEAATLLAKATGKPLPSKPAHSTDQPCPFAAAALPLAAGDAAPLPSPAMAQTAAFVADFPSIPGLGLVAPPPFATGPPLRA